MKTFDFLASFIMLVVLTGCENKEIAKIKAQGYTPPIPLYNISDFCVSAVSNSSVSLSIETLMEICINKEHDAKDKLYEMQEEGKPIGQERWMSCLELSTEHEGQAGKGSYSVLHECAIGKVDLPTKKPVHSQSSGETRKSQAAEGKKLHLKIIKKYPSLGSEYREPFISGGLTSSPICLISVPAREWTDLSNQQKLQLFDYSASLIPVVKANPEKYSGLGPNAPIAPQVRQNVSRMSDASWAVDVGEFTNGGRDLLSGNFIRSL